MEASSGNLGTIFVFRVKICGLTSVADALEAVSAGADAIGLNFYPQSPRFVSPQLAAQISRAIGSRAVRVGVFVNCPSDEIRGLAAECGLDAVQLHGDEPPSAVQALAGVPVIRALRISTDLSAAEHYLAACQELAAMPRMVLVDAAVPGQYGGSGQTPPWEMLARRGPLYELPLILAGGLCAENVAAAIAAVQPHGVDVASGVEETPGRKSVVRMRAFAAAARNALGMSQAAQ